LSDDTRSFGKYLIDEQVGRGGFATVYCAWDTTLDREIALKILHPHYTIEPDFAERFLHEARTVASLNHPHIITLYEVGDLDGQLFIAMELVRGGSLYQRLESDGPMGVGEAINLLTGVADALDYAHGKGLIHRDIKPANILLRSTHRNQIEGVLTDFGLVKALSRSTQLTRSGTILGTLEYMAPEQIDSDLADQIGPATDIYALGIVAYQILTGQAPFTGSTAQVMNGHLNKTPPSPAEIRAEVPAGVSDAILKAISKNPADRYTTALEFVNALKDAETTVAAPASVPVHEPKAPAPATPLPEPTPPSASIPATNATSERGATIPPAAAPPPPPVQPAPKKRSPLPLIIGAGAIIGLILIFVILRGTVFKQEDPVSVVKVETIKPAEPGIVLEEVVLPEETATPTTIPTIVPTRTPTPTPVNTPTLDYTPTPEDDYARIDFISIADGQYVVDFETVGFTPNLPGQHVHFFFDTVDPEDAGVPGSGPWQLYPAKNGQKGTSPFTLYSVKQRPNRATQMCVLVANANHSVQQSTGNCFDLP